MSDLFKNAVQSIILGLEDYQTKDADRTLSAVRNYYAGLLLLAKEVLVRAVPDVEESEILAANYKPVPDGSGGVKYVKQKDRSIDLNGIGTRFKDFGLQIDHRALQSLSKIRNEVEHLSSRVADYVMRNAIAQSFPLVYTLFRQAGEEPHEILEHTWETMLGVRTVYEQELKSCRATFDNIEWNSDLLAGAPRLCVECRSELVAQNKEHNNNKQQIEADCRSCGATIGAEKMISYSIAEHLDGLRIRAARYGAPDGLQNCPECDLLTYVVGAGDDGCVWCDCKLGECAFCETRLTPDDVDFDDDRLCTDCGYKLHKDD